MALNALTMIVTDEQLQELYRIMIDGDEAAALVFLRVHLRSKVRDAMEGGGKVLLEVPGAGIHEVGGVRPQGT